MCIAFENNIDCTIRKSKQFLDTRLGILVLVSSSSRTEDSESGVLMLSSSSLLYDFARRQLTDSSLGHAYFDYLETRSGLGHAFDIEK